MTDTRSLRAFAHLNPLTTDCKIIRTYITLMYHSMQVAMNTIDGRTIKITLGSYTFIKEETQ